ncbi:MAG: hypothetical protein D6808_05695 [Candidatus Dadabacteria bacterium]|nr:MAG: hypothetical protein D6808_05695 [Candidatus Dadabacteria bacterium]
MSRKTIYTSIFLPVIAAFSAFSAYGDVVELSCYCSGHKFKNYSQLSYYEFADISSESAANEAIDQCSCNPGDCPTGYTDIGYSKEKFDGKLINGADVARVSYPKDGDFRINATFFGKVTKLCIKSTPGTEFTASCARVSEGRKDILGEGFSMNERIGAYTEAINNASCEPISCPQDFQQIGSLQKTCRPLLINTPGGYDVKFNSDWTLRQTGINADNYTLYRFDRFNQSPCRPVPKDNNPNNWVQDATRCAVMCDIKRVCRYQGLSKLRQ